MGYLEAEKRQGRVAPGTDSAAIALAIVGTAHHLTMTGPAELPDREQQLQRLITLLATAAGP